MPTTHRRVCYFLMLIVCAAAQLGLTARSFDAQTLPFCVFNHPRTLTVTVEQVRPRPSGSVMLDVRVVTDRTPQDCASLRDRRLRLNWRDPVFEVRQAERLHITARLKMPWGMSNPGGFDYGRWLRVNRYAALGSVTLAEREITTNAAQNSNVNERSGLLYWPLLRAITVGERGGISQAHWQLFRRTGTVHLMVVSGLHVSILAMMVQAVLSLLRRLLPAAECLVTQPAIGGLIITVVLLAYAWLNGAQAPVVRATCMALLLVWLFCVHRKPPFGYVLAGILLWMLIVVPDFAWQAGFWLSFAAVGVLLCFFAPRGRPYTWTTALILAQWAMFVGLLPWLAGLLGSNTWLSPLANFVAVPLMSVVTVPCAMVGMSLQQLWPHAADVMLYVADVSLAVLLDWLRHLADAPAVTGVVPRLTATLGVCGALLLMIPGAMGLRLVGLLMWCTLFAAVTSVPFGAFRILALDVGQGSAAIVDTARHRLLVDTGAVYSEAFNLAESVVVPALQFTGPNHADALLLSHLDDDHAAGAPYLWARYPRMQRIGGNRRCVHGASWIWDGVRFTTLVDNLAADRNGRSCTLLVQNNHSSAYFSGDIGKASERRLLAHLPQRIDWLLAPHHGSASSSSWPFVRHLRPRQVIFSAARDSRYGHPHPGVVARYQHVGSTVWVTGWQGALQWSSERPDVMDARR